MSAMTPRFIRMRVWPAPGVTGGGRRASRGSDACRPAPLLAAARVDVGMIGGKTGRHLRTLSDGPVAGDHDIHVPGSLPHCRAAVSTVEVAGRDRTRRPAVARGH